jgi:hypothetical protein
MNGLTTLPSKLRLMLEGELQPSEHVVYVGRPTFRWNRGLLIATPFYLIWTAMWLGIPGVFITLGLGGALGLVENHWEGGGTVSRLGSLGFALFATPHMAIGLYSLFSPFLSLFAHRTTVHAVTNRRVLTVHRKPFGGSVAKTYPAQQLTTIEIDDHGSAASLTIGVGEHVDSDGDKIKDYDQWSGLPDGTRAAAAIRALKANAGN